MSRALGVLSLLILLAGLPGCRSDSSLAPPEGFVSLFNGRDLTGWTYDDSGHWGVEEGLLTYDGGDGNPIRTPTTSATSGPKRSSGTSSF